MALRQKCASHGHKSKGMDTSHGHPMGYKIYAVRLRAQNKPIRSSEEQVIAYVMQESVRLVCYLFVGR